MTGSCHLRPTSPSKSMQLTKPTAHGPGFDSTSTTPINAAFPPGQNRQATIPPATPTIPAQEDESDLCVEEDLESPVPGWPQVAKLMAEKPDFAAFDRFRDLHAKSLLYYQAELTHLRLQLHEQEWNDSREVGSNAEKFSEQVELLAESLTDDNNLQWKLVLRIRHLLKEYGKYKMHPLKKELLMGTSRRSFAPIL